MIYVFCVSDLEAFCRVLVVSGGQWGVFARFWVMPRGGLADVGIVGRGKTDSGGYCRRLRRAGVLVRAVLGRRVPGWACCSGWDMTAVAG